MCGDSDSTYVFSTDGPLRAAAWHMNACTACLSGTQCTTESVHLNQRDLWLESTSARRRKIRSLLPAESRGCVLECGPCALYGTVSRRVVEDKEIARLIVSSKLSTRPCAVTSVLDELAMYGVQRDETFPCTTVVVARSLTRSQILRTTAISAN